VFVSADRAGILLLFCFAWDITIAVGGGGGGGGGRIEGLAILLSFDGDVSESILSIL